MSHSPVRFGICGCGNAAGKHARSLDGLDEASLVCVWDPHRERCEAFAATHGTRAAPDPKLLFEAVDVVLVSAPTTLHAEVAREAVRAGRHVLVEKPIDVDLAAAENLVREAREAGVVLSVVSQHRFHDDMLWLHDVLAAGSLGRPVTVEVFSLWCRDQAYYEAPGRGLQDPREGGVLLNQAVHAIDLLLWLAGPALDVGGIQATLTHAIAVEDTAIVTARLASGALASLTTTTSVHPQEPERLAFRCEKGSAVVQGGKLVSLAHIDGVDLPPRAPDQPELDGLEPFRRQHRDVCAALREGRTPLVTGEQALAVLAFVQGALRSQAAGARICLAGQRAASHADPGRGGHS